MTLIGRRWQTTREGALAADAGRGGCADPPERVTREQRRCRARLGRRVAHRRRDNGLRNDLLANDLVSWANPLWQASRRILIGITCSGTPSSATRPVTVQPTVQLRCEICYRTRTGPRRRGVTTGNRRGDTAGPVRPHYRSACRNCADSWDGPSSPDYRASSARSGPCGTVDRGTQVLVAGDTLSDVFIPMLDLSAAGPDRGLLAALRLLEGVADDVDVFVPGHGSVGGADQVRARIDQIGRTCRPCVTSRLSATRGSAHRPRKAGNG